MALIELFLFVVVVVVREPDYEQNDDDGVRLVFGLEDEGPLNQVRRG